MTRALHCQFRAGLISCRPVTKRLMWAALALVVLAAACSGGNPNPTTTAKGGQPLPSDTTAPPPPKVGYLAKVACSIPNAHQVLHRIWEGYRPGLSGQVQYIPIPPNFVDGGINHSGPWNYLQKVPLLFYGPGYIQPGANITTPTTLADIAPTVADLLHFSGYHTPDGHAITQALLPESQRKTPPKLVVTLVWDAGGMDVLDFWKHNHPNLDALIPQGAWASNTTVGTSPSSTAPDHAIIGTGTFPRHSGIVGNDMLINGVVTQPWKYGPKYLLRPTLADVYDKAKGNKPLVGLVGTTPWYLGMIGHGAQFPGGDKDLAVLRPVLLNEGAEGNRWGMVPADKPFYSFPSYVNDLPPLKDYFRYADGSDGNYDGLWEGRDITSLQNGFDTPARLPYQTRVIEDVIKREGFGHHSVPDLFYINYKLIDEIAHLYYFESPEEGDTVKSQDSELKKFVDFLNTDVGKGKYVLIVTADHGHTPNPAFSHGFRISGNRLKAGVAAAFGQDSLLSGKPTYLFMNMKALHRNGFTPSQVALYLLRLNKGDTYFTAPSAFGPADPPGPAHRGDPIIEAAFPSSMLTHLPCLPEAHAG